MAIYHQSAGANQVAILTVEPPSTQQSTRNVAHKNTPPSTSRWLDNTLRRRAGSRSAGPARTRSGLHASEIRAAGPTNRVGNISDDQGEGQARAPAGYCDKRHDDRASIARGRWHEQLRKLGYNEPSRDPAHQNRNNPLHQTRGRFRLPLSCLGAHARIAAFDNRPTRRLMIPATITPMEGVESRPPCTSTSRLPANLWSAIIAYLFRCSDQEVTDPFDVLRPEFNHVTTLRRLTVSC
jgi:hypothetical protein